MKVVDSHVHVWDPAQLHYGWLEDAPGLNAPFLPADLPHSTADTSGCVFVQADCADRQSLAEVDWVASLAPDWPRLSAVVASAEIERGDAVAADVEQLLQRPLVKGVRRIFQDRDESFILAADTIAGARRIARAGLTFDACIRHGQLAALTEFARQLPELRIVLDHMGKPPIAEGWRTGPSAAWASGLATLAHLPNVSVKLSGAGAEAAPGVPLRQQALPFLEETLRIFGPNRCMIGSDWPVSFRDTAGYAEWLDLVLNSALRGASTEDRDNVALHTAARFYGLDSHRPDQDWTNKD